MQKIRVELEDRSYSIVIGSGNLRELGGTLQRFEFSKKLALVSNPTVYGFYGKMVADTVKEAGFDLVEVIIPDGEEYKNLTWVDNVYGELLRAGIDRKSALIALGGGVIGDLTGFVAATFMRGIDFIQVPTTLLSQVDSSVGGKTGVNHALGKNMIGAFWQPRLVWVDIETLKTLPKRQLLAGISEVIKYGVIWDEDLFEFLEVNGDMIQGLDAGALTYVIRRSCEIKSDIVSKDERESGPRAVLNFGHTVGHAIETLTGYTGFLHGEAVGIGMHAEARLAHVIGLLGKRDLQRVKSMIELFGLPFKMPPDLRMSDMMEAMQHDKKTLSGELRFVLPEKIGAVKVHKGIKRDQIESALRGI